MTGENAPRRGRPSGPATALVVFLTVAALGFAAVLPSGTSDVAPQGTDGPDAATPPRLLDDAFTGSLATTNAPVIGALPGSDAERAHPFPLPAGAVGLRVTLDWTGDAALALVVEVADESGGWTRVASASGGRPLVVDATGLPSHAREARVLVQVDDAATGAGVHDAEYRGAVAVTGAA